MAAEDGLITAVGGQAELGSRLDWHNRVDLPGATVLPRLINGHVGDDTQFQLEESEVRLAQSLGEHEEFIVVFVTNVFDSARRRFIRLPNPFAPGGDQHYRVAGKALRLRFELPATVDVGAEGVGSLDGQPPKTA